MYVYTFRKSLNRSVWKVESTSIVVFSVMHSHFPFWENVFLYFWYKAEDLLSYAYSFWPQKGKYSFYCVPISRGVFVKADRSPVFFLSEFHNFFVKIKRESDAFTPHFSDSNGVFRVFKSWCRLNFHIVVPRAFHGNIFKTCLLSISCRLRIL